MAIELPDVEETWRANVAPYVAAMAELIDSVKAARDESLAAIAEIQAALEGLHGGEINIGVDATGAAAMDEAAAAAAKLAAADQLAKESADTFIGALAAEDAALSRVTAAKEDSARASALLAAADALMAGMDKEMAADAAMAADTRIAAAARESAAVTAAMAEESAAMKATGHETSDFTDYVLASVGATISSAGAARILADAEKVLADSEKEAAAATPTDALHGVISAMRGAGTATRFFGLSMSALHWIVGVSAEALAVLIPAIIAFGAGLDVAMQGAVNAAGHMTALWTAAEATNAAFHQTMGTLLGLRPVLQQAQDAANPGVYELLGSAVNDAKTHMASLATAGLDVVHMFDEFSARITVDMQQMSKSGEMQALLGNMVSDLQELGQVFGNVGHAVLNLAADMPGLAEVLLGLVDDVSKVILWVSQLPHGLILGAMALEEFYRWGGLAASIIARIGLLLPMLASAPLAAAAGLFSRLAGIMGAITGVGAQFVSGFAKVAQVVGRVVPVANEASTGLYKMAGAMSAAAQDTAMMGLIGAVVAGTVLLVAALSRVKDATDQWVASTDKAVQAASDLQVYNVLGRTMEQNAIRTQYAKTSLDQMAGSFHQAGQQVGVATARFGAYNGEIQRSAQDVQDLTQQQQFLSQTARTVGANVNYLANTYHISRFAAQALAQEAGVNLQHSLLGSGQAAQIARQQIANLTQGLGAMSAPAGVVGNDMEALGIQSQLAGTKVQQLNQAWDAWMQSVTSSMADFAQVQTALGTMSADVSAKSRSITGAISSISMSGTQMTYTLRGMSQDAMQSWQQLTSALNQGNSALDQLRVGMAEGVVTGGQFKTTVQGLVGEFIPFVAGNRTAIEMLSNLAHEAGGPVTQSLQQLEEWAGVKGKAAADQFAKGMNNASQAMGNMSKVAQNLSAVVSSDLDAALAQNITQTSGVSSAVSKYAQDLANAHTPASTLHADVQAISAAMAKENQMTAAASQGINKAGNEAAAAGAKMIGAARYANAFAAAIENIPSNKTIDVNTVYSSQVLHGIAAAGAAGHASGTPNAAPGIALVGERGPELMMMHGGEAIFSATETARMLQGIPSAIFGATGGSRAGSGGGAGGAGGGAGGVIENHIHVLLDGREIYTSVQQQGLRYNTRNSGGRTGKFVPGK